MNARARRKQERKVLAPPDLFQFYVAHHEAGHCVANLAQGIRFLDVSIIRRAATPQEQRWGRAGQYGGVTGMWDHHDPKHLTVTSLVGPYAEARVRPRGYDAIADNQGDMLDIHAYLKAVKPAHQEAFMQACDAHAKKLVEVFWQDIRGLARALQQHAIQESPDTVDAARERRDRLHHR